MTTVFFQHPLSLVASISIITLDPTGIIFTFNMSKTPQSSLFNHHAANLCLKYSSGRTNKPECVASCAKVGFGQHRCGRHCLSARHPHTADDLAQSRSPHHPSEENMA